MGVKISALLYYHTDDLGRTESPRGLQRATVHHGTTQEYSNFTGITLRSDALPEPSSDDRQLCATPVII